MKTNKSIKLISSVLILLIIFSLSLSAKCTVKEVSTDTGPGTVDDPEGSAAFFSIFVVLFIMAEGERIKNEKALDKAIQEANEEKKAKAVAEAESFNAEIEAQYDFRQDLLNTLLHGPGGADYLEDQRKINAAINKMIEIGKDVENQDSENQNTSITTVPQEQDTTQITEKEKPTGTITLTVDWSGVPGEMIIDFDSGAVSGSFSDEEEIATYAGSFTGSIDLETNIITASGSAIFTSLIDGEVINEPITVEGVLSPDYKSAEGTITNMDGEFPFTARTQ